VVFWGKTQSLEEGKSSARHESGWKPALHDSLDVSAYVGIKFNVAKDGSNGYLDAYFRNFPIFWLEIEIDLCQHTSPVPAREIGSNYSW